MKGYDDIINLEHHVSEKHPKMPSSDRAAQFAPFAALSGYGAAVSEASRTTDQRIEMTEDAKALVDEKLRTIAENIGNQIEVCFRCFIPDERKAGGHYEDIEGIVKKIDLYERQVILISGEKIPIDDILTIS